MTKTDNNRPVIAVTIGDPAGIGPEIVLNALTNLEIFNKSIPVVIGSVDLLRRCAREVGIDGIEITSIDDPSEASGRVGRIDVIDVPVPGMDVLEPGKIQVAGGMASDAYIRKACDLARAGKIDAISTAPINKESLRAAGIEGIGHTEMLAQYLNSPNPLTLFVTENMRIFFLSRHLSLRKAIDYITEERMLNMILRVDSVMKNFGFPKPHFAVAALNPHASDGGQFGDEEAKIITPAIVKAIEQGVDVTGPIGADSVFNQALEGRYDCVISLYHDQGHIAAKTRDFFRTVTATFGLPVLRTSVDHGTGFDIAWQGKASSVSMEAAIIATCDFLKRMRK
ncbi:MAG: 4-hydroxythreonine-4-phosphate dehydrogenase PdxA [Armatimonadota bacterium]